MQPATYVLSSGMVAPDPVPVKYELPPETGLDPIQAFSCGDRIGSGVIAPARLRRLGRTQKLIVAAACEACAGVEFAEDSRGSLAVAIGSGAGEQNDTVDFLRNVFALNEAEPKPARFVNSVPSSLSAQVAMELGFRGENMTCIHHSTSFELALWQAAALIRGRRATRVLAGGVDALEADLLAVGRGAGWWRTDAIDLIPLQDDCVRGVVPGEGAGALQLGAECPVGGAPRLAFVHARPLGEPFHRVDGDSEAEILLGLMKRHGVPCDEGTLILSGANGSRRTDAPSLAVLWGIAARVGRTPAVGVFKHRTGEFCSAPALGAVLAVRALKTGVLPEGILLVRGDVPREIRAVVCHALSEPGGRGIMAFVR